MAGKYAGAMLKATKVGGKRYTTVKSLNKARALVQAAEKATHGRVLQAGEIYRDDLIEAIVVEWNRRKKKPDFSKVRRDGRTGYLGKKKPHLFSPGAGGHDYDDDPYDPKGNTKRAPHPMRSRT